MTSKQFYKFYEEADNYTDPDAFASDAAISILGPDHPGQEVDVALFEQLSDLWHVANDPFRTLLERMGLSQSECSRRFCIPLRTVQDWAGGRRTPPTYVRLMMAELTGLVNRHNRPAPPHPRSVGGGFSIRKNSKF